MPSQPQQALLWFLLKLPNKIQKTQENLIIFGDKFLSFPPSENILTSLRPGEHAFWIQDSGLVVFFERLKTIVPLPLVSTVSDKESVHSNDRSSTCKASFLSAFEILSLIFTSFTVCLGMYSSGLIPCGIRPASWICRIMSLAKIGKFSSHYFFKCVCSPVCRVLSPLL